MPLSGYNFTERVRKVLAMAREEAARLHHEYVGTEHILLALVREGEGVASTVLQNLSVDLDEVQQKVEEQADSRSQDGLGSRLREDLRRAGEQTQNGDRNEHLGKAGRFHNINLSANKILAKDGPNVKVGDMESLVRVGSSKGR